MSDTQGYVSVGIFETISLGKAIQKCIDDGVVLDYKYHKGCTTDKTVLRDLEYPFKVNASAEHKKRDIKFKELEYQDEDAEGNAIWTMEDKIRFIQIYSVCCHYVVENDMCTEFGEENCDVISEYYADIISTATETVLKF